MNRFVSRSCVVASLAVTVLTPSIGRAQATLAPQVFLSHTLGNFPDFDPLVDPNTFFVFGGNGESKDLPISVQGVNYDGDVTLTVRTCCTFGTQFAGKLEMVPRVVTIRNTRYAEPIARLTPIDLSVPKEAWAEAARVQRPALRVTTSRGLGDAGTFVAVIGATGPPTPAESYAVFSIVDIRSEPATTTPSCPRLPFYPAAPEVLPLGPVTRQLFDKKAANPTQTRFSIGASTVSHKDGWMFIVDKADVPLRRDQALVVYDNTSAELQSVWTYNSDNCAGATQNMIVAPFMKDQMTISRANATTMVLGDPDRGDIAVFSEPNFWALFGGRRVTISRVYASRN